MPLSPTIIFRSSPPLGDALDILAAHEGRSRSDIVRRLLLSGGPSLSSRLCAIAVDESVPLALRERASVAALDLDAEVGRG